MYYDYFMDDHGRIIRLTRFCTGVLELHVSHTENGKNFWVPLPRVKTSKSIEDGRQLFVFDELTKRAHNCSLFKVQQD